jgi:predicted PurR-regulated permease PerM
MPLNSTSKSLSIWSGIALLVALLLWVLGPVLVPFVVAAVLAYALHPAVKRLQQLSPRVPQVVWVVLVECTALLVAAGIVLLLVPILTREIPLLQKQLPSLLDAAVVLMNGVLHQLGLAFTLDMVNLKAQVLNYLSANREDWLAPLIESLKLGGNFALAALGHLILIPVVLFYLLKVRYLKGLLVF